MRETVRENRGVKESFWKVISLKSLYVGFQKKKADGACGLQMRDSTHACCAASGGKKMDVGHVDGQSVLNNRH